MQSIENDLLAQIFASSILIVEDNEINRVFLEKMLHARGFTHLLSVASAEEALAQIDAFNPDLVILDIMMPGMDGFECCAMIRSQHKYRNLPILIQTSIVEPGLRVKAFEMGATDFVSKPVYAEELCARVMVHLEKRHSLNTLQLYRNRIEIELESARQLQLAILPNSDELAEIKRACHLDISACFQPSSEIGGDFWGAKMLFPHQTAFWLIDFSGHGVAGALNAFRLQAYLKEYSSLTARPGEYLSHLNDKLLHLLLRGQFATMFYGIIDTQSSQLFYACACAPHPIILRKNSAKPEMIDGSGTPLGIGMHLYSTQSVAFAAGDTLVLYSDAMTETPNQAGECITEAQIMELLARHRGASAAEIKRTLFDYFMLHTNHTISDDLTITVCTQATP